MSDTEETPEETSRMATNYVDGLISQEATLDDDITDYLDENPFEDFEDSMTDLDKTTSRIEDLRTLYRGKHNELNHALGDQLYEKKYGELFPAQLEKMKRYILHAKAIRRKIRYAKRQIIPVSTE